MKAYSSNIVALIGGCAPLVVGLIVILLHTFHVQINLAMRVFYFFSVCGLITALFAIIGSQRTIVVRSILAMSVLCAVIVQILIVIFIIGLISASQSGLDGVQ